jgi:hypothetical protein
MSNDYYSKKNPHGPWGSTPRPSLGKTFGKEPHEVKTAGHIEGFSTPKNIKEWSEYASANSGPKAAPGLGRKTAPATIRKPFTSGSNLTLGARV